MNIHVGNLAREVTEEDLRQEFKAFGEVATVSIIKDRYSGESRGFAFVEMPSSTEAQAAIAGLKGKMVKERTLDVSEARPSTGKRGGGPPRDQRAGGYGARGNSGYGRGGGRGRGR